MSYEQLNSLPIVNGVTLIGDKSFEQYGLVPMNSYEIVEIFLEVYGFVL